jgi:hypothetical protein
MWENLIDRVYANTVLDPDTGCRIWQGQTDGKADPYGRMTVKGQTVAVHIAVMRGKLQRMGKKLPKGWDVDHKCTVRLCCNAEHLQPVTKLKNQRLKHKRAKYKGDALRCLEVR